MLVHKGSFVAFHAIAFQAAFTHVFPRFPIAVQILPAASAIT